MLEKPTLGQSLLFSQSLKISLQILFDKYGIMDKLIQYKCIQYLYYKRYKMCVEMLFVEIWFAHLHDKSLNNNYVLKAHNKGLLRFGP